MWQHPVAFSYRGLSLEPERSRKRTELGFHLTLPILSPEMSMQSHNNKLGGIERLFSDKDD